MTDSPHVSVVRNEAAKRYELVLDTSSVIAGFAAFRESETHITFTHTEVDDAYQGQGLAAQLADVALTDAVARDLTIVPACPYIERYLKRHPIEGSRVEWPGRAPQS